VYKRTRRSTSFRTQLFVLLPCLTRSVARCLPSTMASDQKNLDYHEKQASPATSSAEPVSGHVSKRRAFPGFSLEVRQEASSFARSKNASNADFDPIPPSKRTWNWGAYLSYWMADAWAVSNWEVGEYASLKTPRRCDLRGGVASSMIAVGLDWRMAIGACVLGNTIMGLVITTNGRIGAIVCYEHPRNRMMLTPFSFILRSLSLHACRSATISHNLWSCPAASWLLFGLGQCPSLDRCFWILTNA
jgi:hypothetical protein